MYNSPLLLSLCELSSLFLSYLYFTYFNHAINTCFNLCCLGTSVHFQFCCIIFMSVQLIVAKHLTQKLFVNMLSDSPTDGHLNDSKF